MRRARSAARAGTCFRRVTLPTIRPALIAGAVLAWARALGEFGATITFAGNFPGTTQTMPLATYLALETNPDDSVGPQPGADRCVVCRAPRPARSMVGWRHQSRGGMSLDADLDLQLGHLHLQTALSVKDGEVLAVLRSERQR
jgi:hypothetical protein